MKRERVELRFRQKEIPKLKEFLGMVILTKRSFSSGDKFHKKQQLSSYSMVRLGLGFLVWEFLVNRNSHRKVDWTNIGSEERRCFPAVELVVMEMDIEVINFHYKSYKYQRSSPTSSLMISEKYLLSYVAVSLILHEYCAETYLVRRVEPPAATCPSDGR